jgi:hypothetical protein
VHERTSRAHLRAPSSARCTRLETRGVETAAGRRAARRNLKSAEFDLSIGLPLEFFFGQNAIDYKRCRDPTASKYDREKNRQSAIFSLPICGLVHSRGILSRHHECAVAEHFADRAV